MPDKIVVDTSSLLQFDNLISSLSQENKVILSIVTVEELDGLKRNRDPNIAMKARRVIKDIYSYFDNIIFDMTQYSVPELDSGNRLNDNIILSCAKRNGAKIFTQDLNLIVKARLIKVDIYTEYKPPIDYKGFKDVTLTNEQLADFYQDLTKNIFNCKINEYIILHDITGEIIEYRKWDGEKFVELYHRKLNTIAFGNNIKPKDVYQKFAIDSIMTNTLTAISGDAGSGKSYLALVCAMQLIESGKYSKLTVVFNPTKARGAADMGYYPGTQLEKAMQSNIGLMLSRKFGSPDAITAMIAEGSLELISMADLRGVEIGGDEILYITEAQNTSTDLIKLCLTRAGEGCKVILDGDYTAQVDNLHFEDNNNGLKRAIEHFAGSSLFGYVELQQVYRSKLADLASTL